MLNETAVPVPVGFGNGTGARLDSLLSTIRLSALVGNHEASRSCDRDQRLGTVLAVRVVNPGAGGRSEARAQPSTARRGA